jgi:hypothetical protein
MPKISTVAELAGQTVSREQTDLIAAICKPISQHIAEAIASVLALPVTATADALGPHHTPERPCRN